MHCTYQLHSHFLAYQHYTSGRSSWVCSSAPLWSCPYLILWSHFLSSDQQFAAPIGFIVCEILRSLSLALVSSCLVHLFVNFWPLVQHQSFSSLTQLSHFGFQSGASLPPVTWFSPLWSSESSLMYYDHLLPSSISLFQLLINFSLSIELSSLPPSGEERPSNSIMP